MKNRPESDLQANIAVFCRQTCLVGILLYLYGAGVKITPESISDLTRGKTMTRFKGLA
jgi:hypothetical protein